MLKGETGERRGGWAWTGFEWGLLEGVFGGKAAGRAVRGRRESWRRKLEGGGMRGRVWGMLEGKIGRKGLRGREG